MRTYAEIVSDVCEQLLMAEEQLSLYAICRGLESVDKTDSTDPVFDALRAACFSHSVSGGLPELCYQSDLETGKIHVPITDDLLDAWEKLADDSTLHPLVRARLAGLLCFYKRNPGKWSGIAVEEYQQAGCSKDVEEFVRGECLSEAVGIAHSFDKKTGIDELLDVVVEYTEEMLESSDYIPGCVGIGMRILMERDRLKYELIEKAVERYSATQFERLLLDFYKGAEKKAVIKLLLSEHEKNASTCKGLLRISHLEKARDVAIKGNMNDEVLRLTGEIEREDWSSEEQSVTETISFSPIEKEAKGDEARFVVGHDGVVAALLRFGAMLPDVLYSESQKCDYLNSIYDPSSLSSAVTWSVEGPEGSRKKSFSYGSDDWKKYALGQHDLMCIHMFAGFSGRLVIKYIASRYGFNKFNITNAFMCTDVYDSLTAEKIGISVEHWNNNDFISAASVLVLTMEPMMRQLYRSKGITTTSTDPDKAHVATFGGLLTNMREQFPFPEHQQAAPRYLEAALADDNCYNLRNRMAHGFHTEPCAKDYVVLFHIACKLLLLSDSDIGNGDHGLI